MMITTILPHVIITIAIEIFHLDANVAIVKTTTIGTTFTMTQEMIADQLIFSGEIKEIVDIHQIQFFRTQEVLVMNLVDDSIIGLDGIFMYLAQKTIILNHRKVRIKEKWITVLMRVQ